LSGGEQQMVAVGRALMAQPDLLAVDELSLGLAPMVVDAQASLQSGVALVIMLGIMIWQAGRRTITADDDTA
jgi:branched-chain amino acid transport system ATP-binding protein